MSDATATIARLRALSEKATPGKRPVVARGPDEYWYKDGCTEVVIGDAVAVLAGDGGEHHADAAHIAAFDRETCLALLACADLLMDAKAETDNDELYTRIRAALAALGGEG